jgi:N-acylneuraminate cytidylyltransferase
VIDDQTVLAVIPARGNSKGLPRKHLLDAGGKPVISWSIEAAQESRYIDRLILSSENEEIIAVAEEWGCEIAFTRPAELATDTAKVEDVLIHALETVAEQYDYLVLLQPTSPLRTAADIDGCLETCRSTGAPACVSVNEPRKSPYWMFRIGDDGQMHPLFAEYQGTFRRQDLPPAQAVNGAVYVAEVAWFRDQRSFIGPDTRAYIMPSARSVDLDGEQDLIFLRALLAGNTQTRHHPISRRKGDRT